MKATEHCFCRSPPAGTARARRLESLKPGVDPEVLNGNVRGSQIAVAVRSKREEPLKSSDLVKYLYILSETSQATQAKRSYRV